MNRLIPILLYICTSILIITVRAQENKRSMDEPVTVKYVDLNRYIGVWYEIVKIPNRFQKQCASNTTATYSLNTNGTIKVINRCQQEDGEVDEAIGEARVVDTISNAKLEVSFVSIFGFHLFWGDYWIIGLDESYQYMIVGTPSRKYGWVLSRDKTISDELFKEAERILIGQGYNPNDFVRTVQK